MEQGYELGTVLSCAIEVPSASEELEEGDRVGLVAAQEPRNDKDRMEKLKLMVGDLAVSEKRRNSC